MAKRLKRNKRGSYVLPNKETVTIDEVRELRNLVNKANRKRGKLIAELPDELRQSQLLFGADTDFIYRKKTARINRFRSKKEFRSYVRALRKITGKNYMNYRITEYKKNYISALTQTFNLDDKDPKDRQLLNKIKYMKLDDFRYLVESGELEDIAYVYYDPEESKLQRIRHQLGIDVSPEQLGMSEKAKPSLKELRKHKKDGYQIKR